MTPATRHGPISRRSRSTRPFRVTTCARSPSSAGKRSRRSRATSGLRASAKDGPNMPSSSRTRWGSIRPTRRGSAPWPTSPSRPRCSSWTRASMRSGGRESSGSARKCRWIVTPSGRRRDCPKRSAGSRFGGCARRRRARSVGASTSGSFTTACWRTGRCRCPCCGRTSSDGSPPRASPGCRLVSCRRPRDRAGSARAGPEAGRRAACLLLARDVRPPGDERSERRHVVARRNRADLLDAGLPLAATNRLARRAAADRGRGVRLSARLVPRWTARCVRPICARRDRAAAAGSGGEDRAARHGRRRRQRRAALVARRHAYRVRLVGLQPAVAHLHGRNRERHAGGRDGHTPHGGQRQPAAALLLQRVGSLSLTHLVPGRTGVDHRLEPRAHPRDRRALAHDRDSRHIAYISNEGGNTALWVIDVPGAQRRQIVASERRYRDSVGRLRLVVVDAAGRPLPARVSVSGIDGRAYAPDDAWRHADEAFDRRDGTNRGFEYGYFHTTGTAELTVPTGAVQVEVWHGPEYRVARADVTVPAGRTLTKRLVLERLANLPARGWWSGDLHVHMNYGGAYRNTPAHLAFQGRAEDLHVVENLIVNKEQRIPDIGYFRTDSDPASTPGFLVVHDQEYHTSYWGHTGLLGLSDHYLLPEYVGYPNTAAASLYPMNADVADLAHAQGALFGYVHPFDTPPDPSDTTALLTYELPVDVALGKVDYLEVMGYSDHRITSGIWYRLLNCGFRIPAGAGTDAFPNFASLRGPPGLVRVFVRSGPALDRSSFMAGLKAGRTFVTNAPLLEFTLGGREIGDEIRLPAGGGRLTARVGLRSSVPIDHLEVIGNGSVVATIPVRGDRTSASDTVSIPVARSGWYVVRAWSDRAALPILDLYPFGSTSPIYVRVGREQVRSREDAEFFVRWIDRLDQAARAHEAWNTPEEREHVLRLLAQARVVYAEQADAR